MRKIINNQWLLGFLWRKAQSLSGLSFHCRHRFVDLTTIKHRRLLESRLEGTSVSPTRPRPLFSMVARIRTGRARNWGQETRERESRLLHLLPLWKGRRRRIFSLAPTAYLYTAGTYPSVRPTRSGQLPTTWPGAASVSLPSYYTRPPSCSFSALPLTRQLVLHCRSDAARFSARHLFSQGELLKALGRGGQS